MSIETNEMSNQHWLISRDEQNIAWCHLDMQSSAVNLLAAAVLDELSAKLIELDRDLPSAIILLSDKHDSFVMGADIQEFTTLENQQQAEDFLNRGHALMNQLEAMRCTTVCMVHGICFGGGTELALACDYIVASDDSKTKFALPEIKLGIHPGYGGTARSIERCGPMAAMNIMLTGRSLSAKAAKRIGLIDEVVADRQLKQAAISFALKKPQTKAHGWLAKLANMQWVRPLVAYQMRKQVAQKASQDHYPAPYQLINLWEQYASNKSLMLRKEVESVAQLATSSTARHLVGVFFLQKQLKQQGKKVNFEVQHVHVIGGGLMGGDIASWCAMQGYSVTVQDQSPECLAQTYQRAVQSFKRKFKRNYRAIRDAKDRLLPDHKGLGVERADIIIEAIFEDKEVKRELYKVIEPRMKKGAILATNTSSIRLEDLSSCLKNPGRLVGLHFFNPVAFMPLVEIVRGEQTDALVVQQALAFGKNIGKLPLAVKSAPGFLVNRILMPYLLEAICMVEEGVAPEAIDKAATDFGMPMGPIELIDTVGLDIAKSVAVILSEALDLNLPNSLDKMINAKHLGKKTGQGFYKYKKGKPIKNKDYFCSHPQLAQDRLVMRLLDESVACLREGIVDEKSLIDAGVIFGTGFAPFTGGPMEYIDTHGRQQLSETMKTLEIRLGKTFTLDEGWKAL
ncbi:MAG: enoyl-CoA hydratase/isomerase family protein [Gammaproteobacteria bacterium]|nr:enoyl-CoA hydratase/isomerase family protein [Gammaproteobacteria bacterium]